MTKFIPTGRRLRIALQLSAVAALSLTSLAANAQTGSFYIDGNGFDFDPSGHTAALVISLNSRGELVNSSAYGVPAIGFYDAASRHLLFTRVISSSNPYLNQTYNGYFFQDVKHPGYQYYAGSFQVLQSTGTATLNTLGWYAAKTPSPIH